jgi:hypothetical protein
MNYPFLNRCDAQPTAQQLSVTSPSTSWRMWLSVTARRNKTCSFFLSLITLHVFIVGVECYCCLWSHSRTHTHGKTHLHEGSARRSDLYLTTHVTHKRETSMPLTVFESAIPESQKSQTPSLNRVTTRIDSIQPDFLNNNSCSLYFQFFDRQRAFVAGGSTEHLSHLTHITIKWYVIQY